MVDRVLPFAVVPDAQADGVVLSTPARGALWQVAAWPETFGKVESAVATACGTDAPKPGKAAPSKDGTLLIRIEPLKWWVIAPDGTDCPLKPPSVDGAWLDMSHDQAAVTLTGRNAAELLKRMVSIDVREHAFPDLSFATTHMHHMITRVLRRDAGGEPVYQVMVMRSYADDLGEITAHHIHRFG